MATKTTRTKVAIDPELKKLAKEACKPKKELYRLPEFDEIIFFITLQELVDNAPGGIVQLVIDLFCGAGGTSEGIEQARWRTLKNCMIIAGINHDEKAIYSQAKNHPNAYYTKEDIRIADLVPILALIEKIRKLFPQCPIIIWASLECTNHSNAKGGLPRDPDSRTLPWDLYRYIDAINPDGIWIENVKEFAEWGPMWARTIIMKDGKQRRQKKYIPEALQQEYYTDLMNKGQYSFCPLTPTTEGKGKKKRQIGVGAYWQVIKELKGTYFLPWLDKVNSYGYHNQYRILNAADFGAPTNRHRLFILFMRKGWPIVFPHPTHAKNPKPGDLFDPGLKPHVAVKTCLDFSVEGRSIFEDGHVESDNTWQRVFDGLVKFVAGGKKEYMVQRNGGFSRVYPVDSPARTVTTTGGNQELVQAFMIKYMGNDEKTGSNPGLSIENPANAITAQPRLGLVQAFLVKNNSSHNNTKVNAGSSIDQPAPTITAMPTTGLIQLDNAYFITRYNNNPDGSVNKGSSIDDPAPTILCVPGLGLINAAFIDTIYGNGFASSVDKAAPTVRTKDGMALVSSEFLLNYQGQSYANSVEKPGPALMTKEKLALMGVKYFLYRAYSGGSTSGSIDNPEGSLTTNPKTALMMVEGWIMDTHYDNVGTSLEEPGKTVTANRKWSYLMNPSWFGSVSSEDEPAVTIVARQDKAPIYLISASETNYSLAIPVFEDDPEIVVKIKEFMALYNIYDIKKRMLLVPELLKIQSFPENYYLAGSKTDQKKYIGNAVPPLVARAIAEAMYWPTCEHISQSLNIQLNLAA